jgi:hypothetical protein
MPVAEPKEAVEPAVATAIQKAKAKSARLRLMKERNEHYLAEQREDVDEELTQELRVSTGT